MHKYIAINISATRLMIRISKAAKKIVDKVFALDKKFYGDNFFTQTDIEKIASGKTKHKLYVDANATAYIIIFKMPSGATYITSLAGTKSARRVLLLETLKRFRNRRIYTHGKEKWGMDLLRECGFKKKGRGCIADEEVQFGDDITRLNLYELYN
jgi:hypothetical protein